MAQFVGTEVWSAIGKLVNRSGVYRIAVPYYSSDAGIELGAGDTLIVNASDDTISGGQTSGQLLLSASRRGALIYSLPSLHAKIVLCKSLAIVSSANFSQNSKSLHEAGALFRDPDELAKVSAYLDELESKATLLGRAELERLAKLHVIPRNARSTRKVSLLEALKRGDPVLEELAFGVCVTGADLEQSEVEHAAIERGLPLPDGWRWYQSPKRRGVPAKIRSQCRGRLFLNFDVEYGRRDLVERFEGHSEEVQPFIDVFVMDDYVVSMFGTPLRAAPVELGHDQGQLVHLLTSGLKRASRELVRRISQPEGLVSLDDLRTLYELGEAD